MKQVYVDVFQFRGSHYEFGYMQGLQLNSSPILPNRQKQWGSQKDRHFIIDKNKFNELISHFSPKIKDEIQGLADALQLSYEEAIRDFGGYYLEYGRSGCSIFTSENFFIRNYDNDPESYEGRFLFFQPNDGGYATVGPTMQITGRTDGMNEKGLVMGYNFVNRKQSEDGFLCNMIGRMILENCANIDEAVTLLKEIPHRHSFNYVLSDLTGKFITVEASPRNIALHEKHFCTNHFDILKEENRYRMDDSIERYESMKTAEKTNSKDPYEAFQLLNDSKKGVFSNKYGAWAGTLHTAAYFPKELKVWFSIGGDQRPVIFDFHKWLKGENTKIKQIKGKLASKTVFVNMKHL